MSEKTDVEFVLIRHGQTADNLTGLLQGHRDTPLDETGIRQAERVAERLHEQRWDAVYSSDLQRAMRTAEIVVAGQAAAVTPCPDLREWNLGTMEGLPKTELEARHPEIMDAFRYEGGNVEVPGGESLNAFQARVSGCLEGLARRHRGQTVLLVAHAGTLRAVFRHIVGRAAANVLLPQVSNGSYSRFRRREDRWQLCVWNDISHLAGIGCRDSATF